MSDSAPTLERVALAIAQEPSQRVSETFYQWVNRIARAALDASGNDELVEALRCARDAMGSATDALNSGEPSRHRYAEQMLQREMDAIRAAIARTQEQSDGR